MPLLIDCVHILHMLFSLLILPMISMQHGCGPTLKVLGNVVVAGPPHSD